MKRLAGKIKNFIRGFTQNKRQIFVSIILILTVLLMGTQIFSGSLKLEVVATIAVLTYGLCAFALRQDLEGGEYLTLLTLPTYFTVAVFLFYFLLPERWITRLPIAALYAIGMYAILLTENIYNVAAERTIQLLRAAQSVGFLLSLVTIFFLTNTLFSLHLPFYINLPLSFLVVIPLVLQALWSMELALPLDRKIIFHSLVISWILSQSVSILSFFPVRSTIAALFITTVFYSLVGMTQQQLLDRLFPKTIREFLSVFIAVLVLFLVITKWGQGIQ
jgi:hypothetical protein